MKPIFLNGFMGSGKTTVGSLLGKALQLPVIDTDQYIEEKYKQRITEIFALKGEAAFRSYEAAILSELPLRDAVITTGGGMPIFEANRKFMKENGLVIFLSCPLDTIFERLKEDETRPLFNQDERDEMEKLYKGRLPSYRDCHLEIKTDTADPQATVDQIVSRLNSSFLGHTGGK